MNIQWRHAHAHQTAAVRRRGAQAPDDTVLRAYEAHRQVKGETIILPTVQTEAPGRGHDVDNQNRRRDRGSEPSEVVRWIFASASASFTENRHRAILTLWRARRGARRSRGCRAALGCAALTLNVELERRDAVTSCALRGCTDTLSAARPERSCNSSVRTRIKHRAAIMSPLSPENASRKADFICQI